MAIILSIKSKTARLLKKECKIPLIRDTNIDYIEGAPDLLIRWGSRKSLPITFQRVLNKPEAIKKASNKAECRKLLTSKRIPVPAPSETEFPVIGRPAKHKAGSGFFVCNNEQEIINAKINGAVYFSKFYPKTKEYRVHVAGDKTLLVSVKEGDTTKMIWNKRLSNFNFRHMHRSEWLENEDLFYMVRLAKKAIRVIGLDFGAVDVLAFPIDQSLPKFVVCEVNTTPALSPLAISKYVKYFNKVLDKSE